MTISPPKHGDLRVCFIPAIPDHAIVIDAPDMASAKLVHDAVSAILTAETEHLRYRDHADIIVQRFEEDSWEDVDPSEYDESQVIL